MNYHMFILPNLIAMLSSVIGPICSVCFLIPLLIQIIKRKERTALKPFIISVAITIIGLIAFTIFIITNTYVSVV